jgi:DME family drug/metabolite transporter
MHAADSPATLRRWPAILALILAAALWSLNGPLIKLLDRESVNPVTIACYRSIIGGLVFLPFAAGRWRTLRNVRSGWPIGSVIAFTTMTAAFVIANTMTEAANVIILQYTSPIWVFLLAPWLLREHPGRREGLVLLVAMLGIAVIFAGNARTSLPGLLVALLSGIGYGTLTVMLRGLRPAPPAVVTAMNAFGSGVILLVGVAIWGEFLLSAKQWGLMLLLALVQFTLPYLLFSWALQRIEAHRAALIVLLETVLNPIWTWLIVGEQPPVATLIGGPLILASVAGWLWLAYRRSATTSTGPPLEPTL